MDETRFGWRVAAPGGRWREFKTQRETGDRMISWGDAVSGLGSLVQVQAQVRARVRESGPGPVPEPEHLNLMPDGRDRGPENKCPQLPIRFPVSL